MPVNPIKQEQLPDGRVALVSTTVVVPEQTVILPERIEYPELKRALDPGTLAEGDTIIVSVQVFDVDGNEKTPENCTFKLNLDHYVEDESKEVLGVLYFNFIESTISVISLTE